MGRNKVIGVMQALRINKATLKAKIACAFGDDPLGGDRELVGDGSLSYVIKK